MYWKQKLVCSINYKFFSKNLSWSSCSIGITDLRLVKVVVHTVISHFQVSITALVTFLRSFLLLGLLTFCVCSFHVFRIVIFFISNFMLLLLGCLILNGNILSQAWCLNYILIFLRVQRNLFRELILVLSRWWWKFGSFFILNRLFKRLFLQTSLDLERCHFLASLGLLSFQLDRGSDTRSNRSLDRVLILFFIKLIIQLVILNLLVKTIGRLTLRIVISLRLAQTLYDMIIVIVITFGRSLFLLSGLMLRLVIKDECTDTLILNLNIFIISILLLVNFGHDLQWFLSILRKGFNTHLFLSDCTHI